MLLLPITWANRVWALPFLSVLCPSERFYDQRGRRHQSLIDRAWQLIRLLRRWLPGRELVFVTDNRFAALELLAQVQRLPQTSLITRLRLDAALYDPAPKGVLGSKVNAVPLWRPYWLMRRRSGRPGQWISGMEKGHEQFKAQALLSTALDHTAEQIVSWFVRRWTMEVTFEKA